MTEGREGRGEWDENASLSWFLGEGRQRLRCSMTERQLRESQRKYRCRIYSAGAVRELREALD